MKERDIPCAIYPTKNCIEGCNLGDTVDEIIGKLAEHADIDKDQAVNLIYKNDESEQIQMELVINSIAEAFDFNDECKRNKWK